MFLEFSFHAHQTRLNEGFILSAYRLVCKYLKPSKMIETSNHFVTIDGVALIKLVLLFCLFVYIRSASTVAPAKVGSKIR